MTDMTTTTQRRRIMYLLLATLLAASIAWSAIQLKSLLSNGSWHVNRYRSVLEQRLSTFEEGRQHTRLQPHG
jgi:hypothetical protein